MDLFGDVEDDLPTKQVTSPQLRAPHVPARPNSDRTFTRVATAPRSYIPIEDDGPAQACMCPITKRIMRDPVSLVDGTVCERRAMELWFSRGHHVNPFTGLALSSLDLTPVPALQRIIRVFLEEHPKYDTVELEERWLEQCIDKLEQQPLLQKRVDDLGWQLQTDRVEDLIMWLRFGDSAQQEHALCVLESLVVFNPGDTLRNNEDKAAIRREGGFAVLTSILHNGTPTQKEVAAFILWKSAVEENVVAIRQAGAILPLKRIVEDGTPQAQQNALNALKMLDDLRVEADLGHIQGKDYRPDRNINRLVELLQAAEEEMDEASGFEGYVISEGIEGTLHHLADLALVSPENPIVVKNAHGIPPTVSILKRGTMKQREAAARLVLNLCVTQNVAALEAEGVEDALRALEYEATGTARSLAQSVLHVMAKMEADRRCLEAEAVVGVERNRYSVTYSS